MNAFENNHYMKLNEQAKWLRGIISFPRYNKIRTNSKEIWVKFIMSFRQDKTNYVRKEFYSSIYEMTRDIKFLEEGAKDYSKSISNFCNSHMKKIQSEVIISKSLESFIE